MKRELLNILRCTTCRGTLVAGPGPHLDGDDLRSGRLCCPGCGASYEIENGIVVFPILDSATRAEVQRWESFAEHEQWLELDELYLESLPSAGSNLMRPGDTVGWLLHEVNFFSLINKMDWKGAKVLDLGAGRCWSSKWLAMKGASVVATDAMIHPTIGLGAADVYMRNHAIHFERAVCDFVNLPFADGSFDVVVGSGSLHHTLDLDRTIAEVSRVLVPGGRLAIINEPVSKHDAPCEKALVIPEMDGINEHAFRMSRWISLMKAQGLDLTEVVESINVYDRKSLYYAGIFGALVHKTLFGRIQWLVRRGGVLNGIATKRT